MASATNLLGLVNQLQNLEISFSKILMETAMKLSALTDLDVFVLIETQDGRRFSGKRHLCDAYVEGTLNGQERDVEFEINPSVFALQQRQHQRPSPQWKKLNSRRTSGSELNSQRSPKRRSFQVDAANAKRRRPNSFNDAASESCNITGSSGGDPEVVDLIDRSGEISRSEDLVDNFAIKDEPEMMADVEFDESRFVEETDKMMRSTALAIGNGVPDVAPDVAGSDFSFIDDVVRPRTGNVRHSTISDEFSQSFDGIDQEHCDELNRQLLESLPQTLVSKLDGLAQFQSGPDLEPGSAEFRLLNSILYEFGIHARSYCPFDSALPEAKKFLYNNLDSLITLFPILDAIVHHGGKFPIGSRQITKLTYFREKTKKAFMKYVKTGPALLVKDHVNAVAGKDVVKELLDSSQNFVQRQSPYARLSLELQQF